MLCLTFSAKGDHDISSATSYSGEVKGCHIRPNLECFFESSLYFSTFQIWSVTHNSIKQNNIFGLIMQIEESI